MPGAGPTMAVIAYKCPDIEVVVVDISEPRCAPRGPRRPAAFQELGASCDASQPCRARRLLRRIWSRVVG